VTDLAPRPAPTRHLLQTRRDRDEQGVVLQLFGELDLSSTPELARELAEIQDELVGRLLIDLRHLEFMDSTGLALIITAEQAARAHGQGLHLRSAPRQIQRLFELTGILDRFTFEG
jgi:anti-sigma B factor antagonist